MRQIHLTSNSDKCHFRYNSLLKTVFYKFNLSNLRGSSLIWIRLISELLIPKYLETPTKLFFTACFFYVLICAHFVFRLIAFLYTEMCCMIAYKFFADQV